MRWVLLVLVLFVLMAVVLAWLGWRLFRGFTALVSELGRAGDLIAAVQDRATSDHARWLALRAEQDAASRDEVDRRMGKT